MCKTSSNLALHVAPRSNPSSPFLYRCDEQPGFSPLDALFERKLCSTVVLLAANPGTPFVHSGQCDIFVQSVQHARHHRARTTQPHCVLVPPREGRSCYTLAQLVDHLIHLVLYNVLSIHPIGPCEPNPSNAGILQSSYESSSHFLQPHSLCCPASPRCKGVAKSLAAQLRKSSAHNCPMISASPGELSPLYKGQYDSCMPRSSQCMLHDFATSIRESHMIAPRADNSGSSKVAHPQDDLRGHATVVDTVLRVFRPCPPGLCCRSLLQQTSELGHLAFCAGFVGRGG